VVLLELVLERAEVPQLHRRLESLVDLRHDRSGLSTGGSYDTQEHQQRQTGNLSHLEVLASHFRAKRKWPALLPAISDSVVLLY
jgi:hypothetical protein